MAGHEISGYISSLWQALFASFIQVFTRIFRFTKTRNNPTQNQQSSPTSTATTSAHIQCNHQDTSSSYSPNPNIPTPNNLDPQHQHQHQHNHTHHHHYPLRENNDISDHDIGRDSLSSRDKEEVGDDNEEDMPQSKKRGGKRGNGARSNNGQQGHGRGGHGRGTGNGNGNGNAHGVNTASTTGQPPNDKGNNTASPRPPSSVTTTNQQHVHPAPQCPPSSSSNSKVQIPAPAVAAVPVTTTNQRGDTRPNDSRNQSDAHKLNGSRRGGGGAAAGNGNSNGNGGSRNHGRSSPTNNKQQPSIPTPHVVPDMKENLAPLTSKDATPQPSNNSKDALAVATPAAVPLVVSGNRAAQPQTQKSGANGNVAAPGAAPVPSSSSSMVKPKKRENLPPNVQVDQLRTAIDGLTFDETPAPAAAPPKALDQGSAETTATTAAAAASKGGVVPPQLPVPVVVPYPGANKQNQQSKNSMVPPPNLPGLIEPKTEEERIEREYHLKFMNEALDMGQLALDTNETPVGCVLVYHGRVIAKGMNATNVTRNGTRHAEFMALSALFSRRETGDVEGKDVNANPTALDDASWGDVDPRDGHIFPYGQKLHPAPVVDRSIISECVLYVTVEPCVMCASLLRQLGIKKVYFGAVNDKFGGTGGVFRIHLNSKPVSKPKGSGDGDGDGDGVDGDGGSRPYQNGYGPTDASRIAKGRTLFVQRDEDDGDGGNVEPGYPVEGGYFRDNAVALLRHFYVQENGRAPQPRKKEGRAARLFALEAAAKGGGSASEMSDTATLPDTPVDNEPPLPAGGEKLDQTPTPTPVVLSTDGPDAL